MARVMKRRFCALLLCIIPALLVAVVMLADPEKTRLPPPGRLIDIGSHELHLYCLGGGQPIVVLESGASIGISHWDRIQHPVSRLTRTCSYDRSGLGWSDRRNGRMSAGVVARELNALLKAGDESGPLILVGASLGGIFARKYAQEFDEDVVGLVLVDSTHPSQFTEDSLLRDQAMPGLLRSSILRRFAAFALRLTGVGADMMEQAYVTMPRPVIEQNLSFIDYSLVTIIEELSEAPRMARELGSLGHQNTLPLIVVASALQYSRDYGINSTLDSKVLAAQAVAHRQLQESLLELSSDSRLVVAEASGHNVNFEQPEVVVSAIEDLVLAYRDNR